MKSAIKYLKDKTIEITFTIPWSEVKKTYEEILHKIIKEAEIKGFRKGKAPRKLVEEKTDKNKIYEEIVQKILPDAYQKIIKEHQIRPIIAPQIQIISSDENKDWQFKSLVCEKPEVELGNYKEEIEKITAKSKIWTPGEKNQKLKTKNQKQPLDEILKTLLSVIKVNLPTILVDSEDNRLLSQSLDEIKSLGLSLNQYLLNTNRTLESFKQETRHKAETSLKLEFALEKIADAENITVSQEEINNAIAQTKNEEQKKALQTNSYFLASILRRQKILDFLQKL